jgi:hypothetical protein
MPNDQVLSHINYLACDRCSIHIKQNVSNSSERKIHGQNRMISRKKSAVPVG